jgi:hypothetical protein
LAIKAIQAKTLLYLKYLLDLPLNLKDSKPFFYENTMLLARNISLALISQVSSLAQYLYQLL